MKTFVSEKPHSMGRAMVALTLALAGGAANSHGTVSDIIAQYPFPTNGGGIAGFGDGYYRPAQTFTALQSAELQSVSLALSQDGPTLPHAVVVELRNTVNGAPGSIILASADIDGSRLATIEPATPAWLTADFSAAAVYLTAGAVYALALHTDDAGYAFACGLNGYSGGTLYDSFNYGTTWNLEANYDLSFQVTAVPEPPTMGLAVAGGLGTLAFGGWRRRHGRHSR